MKAVTPIISLIMMLLISIGLVGSSYVWFNSVTNSQTSQAFRIIGATYGEILVTNIGTGAISSLTVFVDGQQVVANIPSAIEPGTAGKVILENLPATSGDHTVRLLSTSMGAESKTKYDVVKVLSIYRCGCLIDDIAANFANKNGYPPMQVTCLYEASLSGTYDLSPYNVVAFDGSDCGVSGMNTETQNNVNSFISGGKGAVITHDTFLGDKNQALQPAAGVDVTGACCDSVAANKLISTQLTEKPYVLPFILPVQCTHTSGEEKTTSEEIYGSTALRDHYTVTNNYGSGRVVFTQWGHCAYNCGCALAGGLPGADEQKSIINAIYWAAGV